MRERLIAGIGSGIAAGALWGLVFLTPLLLDDATPLQQSVGRYLAYGAIALALLLPRWRAVTGRLGAAEWRALAVLSLLGNLVYFVLLASAVRWVGSAATALIVGLLPVAATVAGAGQADGPRLRTLLGPCVLCVAGVALVAADTLHAGRGGAGGTGLRALGLACAGGALLSWTAYSIGNARWLQRRPDISARDWSLLTGVVTGALAMLLAPAAFWPTTVHLPGPGGWLRFWGLSALLALLASVIGNACWNRASRLLPLSLMAQMIVFETIFALCYGFLWQRRLPGALELLAIACLLAGVAWCAALHARHPQAPAHGT